MSTPRQRHRHTRCDVRHQQTRAKARAERYARLVYGPESLSAPYIDPDMWREGRAKFVAHHAVDRKPCSCEMCGNRRRSLGPPVSERKLEMMEDAEIRDVFCDA